MSRRPRLGMNVDHVATVRNARGADHPDPVRAALEAAAAGADGITAHLREDRRHIRDGDVRRLRDELPVPLNLEMAPSAEMAGIASDVAPHAVCLVPERREELTTEGGLDVAGIASGLEPIVARLRERGIRVSMFIEPDRRQIEASQRIGAPVVELHTGRYCGLSGEAGTAELERIREAAEFAAALGLEPHAGHGLTFGNVGPIAAIRPIAELNIGHFLVGEAIFTGLGEAVRTMRGIMDRARGA